MNKFLAPGCFSSELDSKSNADFIDVVAFFSARLALDSRKSFKLGDVEGVLTDPDGADLTDFGVVLLVANFALSTSVFSTGRLEPPCRSFNLLKMVDLRSLGLELGVGVKAGV